DDDGLAADAQLRARLEQALVLARVLDHERAVEPVWAPDPSHADELGDPFGVTPSPRTNHVSFAAGFVLGFVSHSTISSRTRRSSCAPQARTIVRSARAMRPPRPMTRPRSSGATRSRRTRS